MKRETKNSKDRVRIRESFVRGFSQSFYGEGTAILLSGVGLVIVHRRVPGLSAASLDRFMVRARRAAGLHGLADVLLTSSDAMRALNWQFRGKNKTTDVLSFPVSVPPSARGRKKIQAGEIAISADIAAQNAARLGHSAAEEVKILALHGVLHLAGFDHERDNGEMARKEMKLRHALNLPVALLERSEPAKLRPSKKARRVSPASARRA